MASTVSKTGSSHEEEKLQSECYKWFHNSFPLHRKMLFHVDNNSWNAIIGARKKALGVNSGVSDLILILFAETVFIEMKTKTGEQSDEQIEFEKKVKARGHRYVILRNLEQFKFFITEKMKEQDEYI